MKNLASTLALLVALSGVGLPTADAQILGAADTEEEIAPGVCPENHVPDPQHPEKCIVPVIELDLKDPYYNAWKKMRDVAAEDPRFETPGPINVQRFHGHNPWIGIPTFFHLPIALRPVDLEAGNVEVAIMGAELVGDVRARTWGPMEMRNPHKSEVYHGWGAWSVEDLHAGVNPLGDPDPDSSGDELRTPMGLRAVDYGDAPIEPMSNERSIPEIIKMVEEIASTEIESPLTERTIPIIIGGGHALMYPDVAGLVRAYDPEKTGKVGVIHFDAHFDFAGTGYGHLYTHGNPVRRLLEEGLVPGKNFIQVGLRGPNSSDIETIRWARSHGLRYHTMAEVERRGWDAVLEDVIAEALDGPEYLFISFDVDVVDPAFIPGTSTPEPGGTTMRETMPLIRRLCAETRVIGFELVELRPDSDPGYTTMLNAKAILRQCLNGLALRKNGITDPDYLHPLTVDDGQPTPAPQGR